MKFRKEKADWFAGCVANGFIILPWISGLLVLLFAILLSFPASLLVATPQKNTL